jgi:hypothetical protein
LFLRCERAGLYHSKHQEGNVTAQQFHPDFWNEFACKRGDCRRICCRDWEIRLTKNEFQAKTSYQYGPECYGLAKSLRRNPDSVGDEDYALCAMRPDGFCSLLTETGLCAWRGQTGEGLCATCSDFPDSYVSFVEDEYVFPFLSCEAVLELLLKKIEPIRLVSESTFRRSDHHFASIGKTHFERRPLLALYPNLLRWGLAILQDRRFSLDDRMVLLAHAMSLVDWMEKSRRTGDLPEAMERFLQTENLKRILHGMNKCPIGPKALLAVNGHCLLPLLDVPAYRENARAILDGLGIQLVEMGENGRIQYGLGVVDTHKLLQRKADLGAFLERKQNFLEHVILCEYLRSMVPITAPNVWDSFRFFNICYALLKGALYGSFQSSPDDDMLVDILVIVHRMFVHIYTMKEDSLERLRAIELTDLTSMVALAKG